MWGPVGARWPVGIFSSLFALILLFRARTEDDSSLRPVGPPALLLLGLFALQLHFQSQTLSPESWRYGAQAAALSSGLPVEVPFLTSVPVETLSRNSTYARFLAFFLCSGNDPLSVEWVLSPLLLLSCSGLLWHTLSRWASSPQEASIALLFAFVGCRLGGEHLLSHWNDRLPLTLCLLLGTVWWIQEQIAVIPTNGLVKEPELRFLIWATMVYALGLVTPGIYELLLALTLAILIAVLSSSTYRKVGQGLLGFAFVSLLVFAQSLLTVSAARQPAFSGQELTSLGPLLLLAPLTLAWSLKSRHWPSLAFWFLGLLAAIVPNSHPDDSLIRFGILSVSLAVPLGLTTASLLFSSSKGLRASGLILLSLGLAPALLSLKPGLLRLYHEGGWPLMTPASHWRAQRPELGVDLALLDCAKTLSSQVLPGEILLSDLPEEGPHAQADCVISALTGLRIAGWTTSSPQAHLGALRRDGLSLALQASARPDLLWNPGISWLLLSQENGALKEALKASRHARFEASYSFGDRKYQLWQLAPSPSLAPERLPAQPPFRHRTLIIDDETPVNLAKSESVAWRPNSPYRLQISAFNEQTSTARLGWLRLEVFSNEGQSVVTPLHYLLGANPLPPQTGDLQEVVFVTPTEGGSYRVRGSLLTQNSESATLFEFSLSISGETSRDSSPGVELLARSCLGELMTGTNRQP